MMITFNPRNSTFSIASFLSRSPHCPLSFLSVSTNSFMLSYKQISGNTYDTLYNQSFFDNAETSPSLKNLKINFIKSIGDVKDGWILIPGTTHKGGYFTEEVVQHGDFNQDPILNELLETKKIEKVANVKFKTIYGSDKIWLQESDIISYLDLIAHDFSEKDRFRGYAWLLHSSKL